MNFKYLFIFILLALQALATLGQNKLQIVDPEGHGIADCQVFSRGNKVLLVSDSLGMVNMALVEKSDTIILMHLTYGQIKWFYNPFPYRKIMLYPDTMRFKKVAINPPCHYGQVLEGGHYGGDITRKKIESGMSVMQVGCVRTARSFELKNAVLNSTR